MMAECAVYEVSRDIFLIKKEGSGQFCGEYSYDRKKNFNSQKMMKGQIAV